MKPYSRVNFQQIMQRRGRTRTPKFKAKFGKILNRRGRMRTPQSRVNFLRSLQMCRHRRVRTRTTKAGGIFLKSA